MITHHRRLLAGITFTEGHDLLVGNADRLLGPSPAKRSTRIMVTLPCEAAADARLVAGLVAEGMDVARINCAHDDRDAWARMIAHLQVGALEPTVGGVGSRWTWEGQSCEPGRSSRDLELCGSLPARPVGTGGGAGTGVVDDHRPVHPT